MVGTVKVVEGKRSHAVQPEHKSTGTLPPHRNEYAVVVCPTISFGRAGQVTGSTVGPLDQAALEAWLQRIE